MGCPCCDVGDLFDSPPQVPIRATAMGAFMYGLIRGIRLGAEAATTGAAPLVMCSTCLTSFQKMISCIDDASKKELSKCLN